MELVGIIKDGLIEVIIIHLLVLVIIVVGNFMELLIIGIKVIDRIDVVA
jgi:hypothetical protein